MTGNKAWECPRSASLYQPKSVLVDQITVEDVGHIEGQQLVAQVGQFRVDPLADEVEWCWEGEFALMAEEEANSVVGWREAVGVDAEAEFGGKGEGVYVDRRVSGLRRGEAGIVLFEGEECTLRKASRGGVGIRRGGVGQRRNDRRYLRITEIQGSRHCRLCF